MGPRAVIRTLAQLGPLAAASALLPPIGSLVLLGTLPFTASWLRSHGETGILLFVVLFAVTGGLALLPTYTPSLVGGWAFGVPVGLAATLLGFAGAATIGFHLSRRLSGDRLMSVLHEYPRGLAIHDAFVGSGPARALLVVTLVRLPPNSPFAMATLLMAGSRVAFAPFLLGTLLGIAPRAAAAVVVGAGLARMDFSHPEQSGAVLAGIGVTVGVALALGLLAKRALRRLEPASPAPQPAGDRRG